MTDRSEGRARRLSEALAYFFTHVEVIRRQLTEEESQRAVDALLTAVRDDGDVEAAVRLLNTRMRAERDAVGLYGGTRTSGAQLTGVDAAGRGPGVYLCPHRRCLRSHWADETDGTPPTCDLDSTPLLLKRL